MELFRIKHDIPFMRHVRWFNLVSLLVFIGAVLALSFKGLNLSVDFTGGTVMEVSYTKSVDTETIRSRLHAGNIKVESVQHFGSSSDILIRLPKKTDESSAHLSEQIMNLLRQSDPDVSLKRVEYVGPQVGSELLTNGVLALAVVALGIMAYLSVRFEWRFAVSGIIANLHDIVIILGVFAFFQWEFSLPVLAGVLAVLGYSVNESVIVFDRIRENFRKLRSASVPEVINNAITRTMSRTVITHGMTQMMVCAMLFLGGEALHNFAKALTIGILFGIYSSVLVASPLLMWLGVSRKDLVKKTTRPADAEELMK